MTHVVNLAEDVVLCGVLQAAEQLQGAILAADTGCVEALRWSGAMPLLLRDLGVQNVIPVETVLACASPETLCHVLSVQDPHKSVQHVAFLLSGFLWDYETALRRVLVLGVIHRVTLCSTLTEHAHECYDFRPHTGIDVAPGASAAHVMHFQAFGHQLSKDVERMRTENDGQVKEEEEEEEAWDADDAASAATTVDVRVLHLPLSLVPLLSAKTRLCPEPSVFVLSHPTCAAAFPLLLHQVDDAHATPAPRSSTEQGGNMFYAANERKTYAHVKDVRPEDIPSAFRRSMRLVAHTLSDTLASARLDVKERIFAVGATSLKIGHTLLRILNEGHEAATPRAVHDQQPASLVLMDRTSDLASPCSFGDALLDRVLALLPQTRLSAEAEARKESMTRATLHVTDIFPLGGCDPTPLSMSGPLAAPLKERTVVPSPFVAQIQWKGGAGLCHPNAKSGSSTFRSLAFRPAKLALRELDKRLQALELELLERGKVQKAAATRRRGEPVRGRDVVLRRISKILEAGEGATLDSTALIELGMIVLETLERMEPLQARWNKCREQAVRHMELRKQGRGEWILPELADFIQRHGSVVHSRTPEKANEETLSLEEVLTLVVHAFALSSSVSLEAFTIQMVQKALVEHIRETVRSTPLSLETALPDLFEQVSPYLDTTKSRAREPASASDPCHDSERDEWEWDDGTNSLTEVSSHSADESEVTTRIEAYVERLMRMVEDCALQYANTSVDENAADSRAPSVVAQLCASIVAPSSGASSIPAMQHIVDASEQLTRAGMDLLMSGFSRFGFGRGATETERGTSSRVMGPATVLVVFVVGGLTFQEIQQVHDVLLRGTRKYQVILGGTTITNKEVILKKLFTCTM
ncbi:hypothetical protein PsorP6_016868 [Peronosclerospora sorghi]|uniref:Uncharacterized protein n=1 Tax=Peronosclerospora sorghi TaxID=230839 RepID=A0ACC0WD93_9STRA|nr:hypothetical protein PsorP6_016868 [Peronosclerospora sorghi]